MGPCDPEELRTLFLFEKLDDDQLAWLCAEGRIEEFEPGFAYREGEPAVCFYVLIEGSVVLSRRVGEDDVEIVRTGDRGVYAGAFQAYLGDRIRQTYTNSLRITTPSRFYVLDADKFAQLMRDWFPMALHVLEGLFFGTQTTQQAVEQRERLLALGSLSAGLTHELNNPASAAQRSAAGMLEELRVYGQEQFNLGKLCLSGSEVERIASWEAKVRSGAKPSSELRESDQAAREDTILEWLRRKNVESAWKIAPELAEYGIDLEQLDELSGALEPAATAAVLSQFASSLRAERIAAAMLHSTARIFDLIGAIKDYSYMDRAPIQDIDIPQSLETTLAMVASRLRDVKVVRDFELGLPHISAYGGELNQVWTALIENALDAVQDKGQIKLAARTNGDLIVVEISDNGPGVPEDQQARIFEPFFTTKGPGSGLGLGLDTVNRIVRIHRGYVSVESKPGKTCFQVRLPIQQLQAY